jgi:integrator complex subunit 6
MGAGNLAISLIPEAMDNSLSYSVLNYLKRLKNQAKQEYDRIVSMTPYKVMYRISLVKQRHKTNKVRRAVEG